MQMTSDMYIAAVDEIISMCTYISYHKNVTHFDANDLARLECMEKTYGAEIARVGLDQGNLGSKKGPHEFSSELNAIAKANMSKVALFSAPAGYFDPPSLNILHKWLTANYTAPAREHASIAGGGGGGGRRIMHSNVNTDGGGWDNPTTFV